MNSLIKICPNCKKHIKYSLDKQFIKMNCKCGFSSSMNIKNIPIGDNNNHIFKEIKIDLEKGYKFLNSDFNTYKDELINEYLKQINELESAYEESYNRNMNMLSFIQILINNYDESVEMRNCILNNCIKIEQCKDNKNINELIKYYNGYNIVESVKIEDIKSIKTITDHTHYVNSLLHLKDGRVASCSYDNTIRIYDPSNDYHCDQVIKRHSEGITSICQLDDGTIVSCSYDKSIMIGDYTIKNAHDDWILKVITLPNNRIASCSADKTIKIWKSNPPYSDTPIKVLKGHSYNVNSLLYIKERDVMISGSNDKTLRLWNMSTYQCDKVIEGVRCCFTNSLYQIDKDRVIVGGVNSFSIVNIDKCIIEKRIEDESIEYVRCFLKLRDNKTILCGCQYGIFCFYDMNTEQYKITKNNHIGYITDLLFKDDNTFLSCSWDKTIKVWKY